MPAFLRQIFRKRDQSPRLYEFGPVADVSRDAVFIAGLFSKQTLLRRVAFRLGLLEIQIRRVVGMLGAVFAGEQVFNRQQLHSWKFHAGGALVRSKIRL